MIITPNVTILYSLEKDQKLQRERGISFETVKLALLQGNRTLFELHPNQTKYPGQLLMYLEIDHYFHVIPYVRVDDESVFLKTIYRSHRINQLLNGAKDESA